MVVAKTIHHGLWIEFQHKDYVVPEPAICLYVQDTHMGLEGGCHIMTFGSTWRSGVSITGSITVVITYL